MKKTIFLLLLISTLCIQVSAQHKAVKTSTQPIIDGQIESLWNKALIFTSFKQIEPEILADATVKTEAYILYDEENLFVAMKLHQDKSTVRGNQGRKDSDLIQEGDYISVILDPTNNGSLRYVFILNPANGIIDGKLDSDNNLTILWDGIFYSGVKIFKDHWSVEIQIPLNSISFQDLDNQNWGIQFQRVYSQNQEKITSKLLDVNDPYDLANFDTITGFAGLKKTNNLIVTPYVYSTNESDFLSKSDLYKGKTGGEFRYAPTSSMTILATINPDYAQIESDKEVINVSDLPTEYPEKRPFFTESIDLYPGAAVNTRNITDIKAGVKIRNVSSQLTYDFTGVIDDENNKWFLGNPKITDNKSYLAELIGGIKFSEGRHDYNITSHILKWLFDKRFSAYNWIGTINNPEKNKNEWETVNTIRWDSRTFAIGLGFSIKSKFYNPNIVGWNYLSNEINVYNWIKYSFIQERGFFRTNRFEIITMHYDLYTHRGNTFTDITLTSANTFHINNALGNWTYTFSFLPKTNQKFRYRNSADYKTDLPFEDAFSNFALIESSAGSIDTELKSDYSRSLGFTFGFSNKPVRGSETTNFDSEFYWKIGESSIIKYSLGYIDIKGSRYQNKLEQVIHRLQIEYNITENINIRVIAQPNILKLPSAYEYENKVSAYNLTLSWKYLPGSYIYFVYNNYRNTEQNTIIPQKTLYHNQTFILKINKSLSI